MPYGPLPDPNVLLDVEVETPAMMKNDRWVACGERQLRMLARMGDVGMGPIEKR